jgi:hypothetical protein
MQQRQLRLGDILDDYCPRERRVTNHAVVAMLGSDVKQTRCTTCDAEHEYKHAKVPRQRRKSETPAALYSQVLANAPKRVAHGDAAAGTNGSHGAIAAGPDDGSGSGSDDGATENVIEEPIVEPSGGVAEVLETAPPSAPQPLALDATTDEDDPEDNRGNADEGPVHRPLIRASLPRHEGQPPPTRPIPEFTIRQPAGRQNRFRPRHQRGPGGGQQFGGNRGNGNFAGPPRGMRSGGGGRPPQGLSRRNGPGRKRSK